MSDKEILRVQLMAQLVEGKIDQRTVGQRLGLGVRQVKRLKRAYLESGTVGLTSKRRGQPSNHQIREGVLAQAMTLVGAHYADFGPTFAAEKLAEQHGIVLSVETVRKNMMAAGYWRARRGASVRSHPMRERRARRGELIQIDGSPHDWFEGRAPVCCLLVFIDDATGELLELQFVDTETTLGYMAALERYILRHGVPAALYSDRHSIFRVNGEAPVDAQSQFARALSQLGIEGIQANSPQAKGRVERANQTLQDRLVKEMRLLGIHDQASANSWLPTFMLDFNRRFAVTPASADDAHVACPGACDDLRRILSVQLTRRLSNNLSCQYNGELLQVHTESQGLSLRGATVCLHQHHDGRIELSWQGRAMAFGKLARPLKQQAPVDGKQLNARVNALVAKRGHAAAADHPWKKAAPDAFDKGPPVVALFPHPKGHLIAGSTPV